MRVPAARGYESDIDVTSTQAPPDGVGATADLAVSFINRGPSAAVNGEAGISVGLRPGSDITLDHAVLHTSTVPGTRCTINPIEDTFPSASLRCELGVLAPGKGGQVSLTVLPRVPVSGANERASISWYAEGDRDDSIGDSRSASGNLCSPDVDPCE